jgi:signal transduction histidine kinase
MNVALAAHTAMGYEPTAEPFASLIGLYTVAAYTDRWRSLIALAIGAAGIAWFTEFTTDNFPWTETAYVAVLWTAGWGLGEYVRSRRDCTSEVEYTAEELRRTREQATREAVAFERAHIARELHDLVGHTVNLMVVQAGAGRRVLDHDPQRARSAFETIEATGRTALGELDRLLNVLHPSQSDSPTAPHPSLDGLHNLARTFTASGLPVTVAIEGRPTALPPSLQMNHPGFDGDSGYWIPTPVGSACWAA